MRLVQISDLHFTHFPLNPFRHLSKRFLGTFNWLLFRKNELSIDQLLPLPQLFRDLDVDLVLFGGDFTTTALISEFEAAQQFVKQLSQPWLAVPGNHDKYTLRSDRNNHFYNYFPNFRKEIVHPVESYSLKEHKVEAHPLMKNWWIVALDTALATNLYSSEGFFSQKIEQSLKEVLALLPSTDSILLLNHYPFFQNDEPRRNLLRGKELQNIIAHDHRIRLYLHGHTHRHTLADLQPNHLPIVLDSGCSTHTTRGSWNLIDLTPTGCTIQAYQWKNSQWQKQRAETFSWK